LPTEKEAGFSKDKLNSDDFTEQRFNEELLWFTASIDDKSKLRFPPDANKCADTVVAALEQISMISDVLGKPELEPISAALRDRFFASSMMTQLKKMEKALLAAERELTAKEIGNSKLIRRDFYYFSRAFIEDDAAKEKLEPWSDNARVTCPCMPSRVLHGCG
jgi:hypothetical protein